MRNGGWFGASLVCGLLLTSCGAAPGEGAEANENHEGVGATSQALDASCTLDNFSAYGYAENGYAYNSFSASLNGRCADGAPVEFRFTVKDPKNRAQVQDFGAQSYAYWTLPLGSTEGTYTLTVDLRRAGSTEIAATLTEKRVLGRVCRLYGVRTDPYFAQPREPVTVEPYFECPDGIVGQWRATIAKPGGGSVALPWTTGTSVIWDTAGILPGTGTLQVSLRNLGNTVVDATVKQTFVLGDACGSQALPQPAPAPAGSSTGRRIARALARLATPIA